MVDTTHPLISILRDQGKLDDLQIEEIVQENSKTGKPILQIIADAGYVSMDEMLTLIANHLGTEVVSPSEADLSKEVLEAIPADAVRMYQCIPVAVYGSTVQVALTDPLNPEAVDQVGFS